MWHQLAQVVLGAMVVLAHVAVRVVAADEVISEPAESADAVKLQMALVLPHLKAVLASAAWLSRVQHLPIVSEHSSQHDPLFSPPARTARLRGRWNWSHD